MPRDCLFDVQTGHILAKIQDTVHNLNTSVTLTKHHYLTPWKKEQVGFTQISLCGIIY